MMFAEATPNANETWNVVLLLAVFGANLATIWAVVRRNRTEVTPQPLEVKAAADFVQRDAFDRHVEENRREHDNLFSKIGGVDRGAAQRLENQMAAIRAERKEDINQLHEKINDVSANVAGLEKASELHYQQLAKLDTKLDRIIENKLTPTTVLTAPRITP